MMVYNGGKVNGGPKGRRSMEHGGTDGISVSDFLRYLLRQWRLVVCLTLAATAVAATFACLQPASYRSSAQIVVLGDGKQQGTSRDIILGNYLALLTSNLVLDKVEYETAIDISELRQNIAPTREKTSEIITIDYTSAEPDQAASVIDSTIKSFSGVITEMYDIPKNGVNIISSAIDAGVATNKDMVSMASPVVMSATLGFLLATVIAFLRFDSKMRNETKAKDILLQVARADLQTIKAEIAAAKNTIPAPPPTQSFSSQAPDMLGYDWVD